MMRNLFSISFFLFFVGKTFSQDTIIKHKLKIIEIAIVGTAPIIPLYNYSSNKEIILSVSNDDDILNGLIKDGYSDTSRATKTLRPNHFFGPMGANLGIRGFLNLSNKFKNKLNKFIPVTVLYESHLYADYIIGKKDIKRIDAVFNSGETIYLDSVSSKATRFRFETQSLYIQSGFNIESGNQYFRFSTGINIGFGVSFKNNLYIIHKEYSGIQPTNKESKYYESTYSYSEDKVQKVKPIFTTRFLVPFCMKVNFKKVKHIGIMGEISPGFEMNKVVKGDLLARWLLFCSLGVRYTF